MKEGFKVIEEIEVPSSFDHLHEVEGVIDRTCSIAQINEDSYGNVLIAVTEAFNNAVVHGNKSDVTRKVKVISAQSEVEVCFTMMDEGVGFDFNNIADPTAPENVEKENGRGIYLMRHLADTVEFDKKGTEVTVFFTKNA